MPGKCNTGGGLLKRFWNSDDGGCNGCCGRGRGCGCGCGRGVVLVEVAVVVTFLVVAAVVVVVRAMNGDCCAAPSNIVVTPRWWRRPSVRPPARPPALTLPLSCHPVRPLSRPPGARPFLAHRRYLLWPRWMVPGYRRVASTTAMIATNRCRPC